MVVPKICLNMIVKNESKIITRLLETVKDLIDSYCICDTGSSDNTVEIIEEYCRINNIPGKILHEEFRDFGYNRSVALRGCDDMENADYILLMDADMKMEINTDDIESFKKSLTKDAYYILQGCPDFFNNNIRIIRNDRSYNYWGVTHEYIELPDNAIMENIGRNVLFINDIGDGGSKANKFKRDIELLEKGLEAKPNNARYLFYLGNSYRDNENYEKAIETYKKRIKVDGWIQETWHSYYSIGNCYMYLDKPMEAIYNWLEAYQFMPTRIENIYKIVSYYREEQKYALALSFYEMACKIRSRNVATSHLFLENDIYEHKLDYEMSIIGYYTNINKTNMINMCMMLLNKRSISHSIYQNILSNYKYYCPELKEISIKELDEKNINLLSILNKIGEETVHEKDLIPSSPSICMNSENPNEIYVCKRYVNYYIDNYGNYINKENIITKNIIAKIELEKEWKKVKECVLDYNKDHDDLYIGLEDVKMIYNNNRLEYTANRVPLKEKGFAVEHGIYNIDNNKMEESLILRIENRQDCEKNWVMYIDKNKERKIIYKWYPLTICDKENEKIEKRKEIISPMVFKYLRGSTNGVHIGNEIWFLCHLVSYEDRRYYYHMFVVLEDDRIKKYSQLFTFEKEKVEYSLGFIYNKNENRLMIGYSTNDNTTKYMLLDKGKVEELFIHL